jgi:hypothetical protein
MRRSDLNRLSVIVARGAIAASAVSIFSLNVAAQQPLPAPVFAAPAATDAPVKPPVAPASTKPTVDRLDAAAVPVAPVTTPKAATASPADNRIGGFAAAAEPKAPADPLAVTRAGALPRVASEPPASAPYAAAIPRITKPDASGEAPDRPHPLESAFPGQEVIICIAGCGREGPQAVAIAPMRSIEVKVAMNTDAPVNTGAPTDCVAGCYDAPSTRNRPVNQIGANRGAPVGATDRAVMVQTVGTPTAGMAPGAAKPKASASEPAKKRTTADWFTKRFVKPATQ